MKAFQHSKFIMPDISDKKVLDIGCGRHKLVGSIGVDSLDLPGVDFIVDLNGKLPFENNSFEVIHSNQVFEHIQNLIGLIEECHRILKPGGILIAHVPYFRSSWAAIDPTHVRQFSINSLHYFVRGTLEHENYRFSETSFSAIKCYLDTNYENSLLRYIFTKLALRWPYRYENSFLSFIYPFQSLTFSLIK